MGDRLQMLFQDHADHAHAAAPQPKERAFDRLAEVVAARQEDQRRDSVFQMLLPEHSRSAANDHDRDR